MAHSRQIYDELMSISELVANLSTETPYVVPLGYFETMPETLSTLVNNTVTIELSLLSGRPKLNTPYRVPNHYFEQFAACILSLAKLQNASCEEELMALSPLIHGLKNKNTFTIPDQYFEDLPAIALEHVLLVEAQSGEDELQVLSPFLRNLQKTIPFILPNGYFEEFASDIIAGVNAVDYVNQELESHAPVMSDIKIKNVYSVPDGYFDKLGIELLTTVKYQKKASIIPFNINKKILRYSVAALVAGIMSVAALTFYYNKSATNSNELAEIGKLSNDEMISYLESTTVTPVENAVPATPSVTSADEDVNELFADVPDEELVHYLDQHAASKDLIIN